MKNKFFFAAALSFIFASFVLADNGRQYFTVEADAIARAKPDKVVLDVGVITKGKNLAETKKKNSDIIKKAIEYCRKSGIEEKNIQTDYLNIRPEYRNYDTYETYFIVNQRLFVILEEISKYDEVIAQLLEFGINQVHNVAFQVNDLKKYRNEARKLAIAAAKERAKYLSEEAGIKLGNIINVSDYLGSGYQSSSAFAANAVSQNISDVGGSGNLFSTDSLAPGMISVKANIILTYEIKK
jgi:uncharacterized protein YggE